MGWNRDKLLKALVASVAKNGEDLSRWVEDEKDKEIGEQADATVGISDLFSRVAPGYPMPSGQCPECGGLCQLVKDLNIVITHSSP
jgi:hypothetical protein